VRRECSNDYIGEREDTIRAIGLGLAPHELAVWLRAPFIDAGGSTGDVYVVSLHCDELRPPERPVSTEEHERPPPVGERLDDAPDLVGLQDANGLALRPGGVDASRDVHLQPVVVDRSVQEHPEQL
jgi:hypothetical protein